jgi:hypothetical protein
VTRLHAVRVAKRLQHELKTDVDVVGGPYGRFSVELDDKTVLKGGALAVLGLLPSAQKVLEAVRKQLDKS